MLQRTFIVKKFVRARSAAEAIKKSAKVPVGEVYEDGEHPRSYPHLTSAIGFTLQLLDQEELGE